MPRPKSIRKDLSAGWRRLYQLWELSCKEKKRYALSLLEKVFNDHQNPVVCWSGGKDSTVVLHLSRILWPNIPVVYVDTGVEFPESIQFVTSLAQEWRLNITVGKPKEGENFWDIGVIYGWPIFGKIVASNVERAIRTGNIRDQLTPFERLLATSGIKISNRCTEFIQERPSKVIEKSLQADIKVMGIRAEESRARVRLWVDHGDYYYIKRYFGRNQGIWKANPISFWTKRDIWQYMIRHNIPYCQLYKKGYPRNGCWPCAMGIRNGQLKRLKSGHPHLFEHLMEETQMGIQLKSIKDLLLKSSIKLSFDPSRFF